MDLNSLGGTPLSDAVDVNNLPEQMGGQYPDPPQPGTYILELPKTLKAENFEKVASTDYGDRVKVKFDDDAPLVIVDAPVAFRDEFLNTPFRTSISNVPRKRGKGDDAPIASDWDYLNRALKFTKRPASNKEYAVTLLEQAKKSARFQADIEFSYRCDERRDAYFAGEGGKQEKIQAVGQDNVPMVDVATGQPVYIKGCGKRYYLKDVAKEHGRYPVRITCTDPNCQASIRAFANLTRFEPVPEGK